MVAGTQPGLHSADLPHSEAGQKNPLGGVHAARTAPAPKERSLPRQLLAMASAYRIGGRSAAPRF
jgi:hypothetical protein